MPFNALSAASKTEFYGMRILRARSLHWLLGALALVMLIRCSVCEPILIAGPSMLPTLQSGQIALINRLVYLWSAPRRGEIVAFWNGREVQVKRVLGLPGEEVSLKSGQFFVNSQPLQETYATCYPPLNIKAGKVPQGTFVLAGDNRGDTIIPVVSRSRIIGRLVYYH